MFSDCLLMLFLVLWQWWTSTDDLFKTLIKTPGVASIAAVSKVLLSKEYLMPLPIAGVQVAGG